MDFKIYKLDIIYYFDYEIKKVVDGFFVEILSNL